MSIFWDFVRAQRAALPIVSTTATVTGGTYIVTGANTGLGFECAKHHVNLGAGHVAIREATGGPNICEVWELDLASLGSVEKFAKRFQGLDRVDALIENVSVALEAFNLSEGMETSVVVNVLGTMLLAIRAMLKLRHSAARFGIKPHLVIVSSMGVFSMKGALEDYPLTKLLQIYATQHLALLFPESDTGVVINVLNPRGCITGLDRNAGWSLWLQIYVLRRLLGRTAEQGSRTWLHAAVAGPESHGKYVSDFEMKECAVPEWLRGEDGVCMRVRVWDDLVETLDKKGYGVDDVVRRGK
ncbi:hypothetical protein ACJZ2D_012955 [Fusarium nematophilum]